MKKARSGVMKNSTHKVVILENVSSPYIHQAIIVLNDMASGRESKAVNDAEKIVDDYLRRSFSEKEDNKIYSGCNNKPKRRKHLFLKLIAAAGIAGIVCAAVLRLI